MSNEVNTPKKRVLSWGWIIVLLMLFWPVGLYYLLIKVNDGKSPIESATMVTIASYLLMALSVMYALFNFSEGFDDGYEYLIASLITGCGAIICFLVAKRMKKKSLKYAKYLDIVINQGRRTIDSIAIIMETTYEEAITDLQHMINKSYFDNAYIDKGGRKIVVLESVDNKTITNQAKKVSCPSCGAVNLISSKNAKCEYCGCYLNQ